MTEMSHRQRILNALDHKESDRVPIDFGGTYTTTIFYAAYDRLTERLGIDDGETQIYSKTRRLAIPSEAVLQRFQIDTRFVGLSPYEGDQREIDRSGRRWNVSMSIAGPIRKTPVITGDWRPGRARLGPAIAR